MGLNQRTRVEERKVSLSMGSSKVENFPPGMKGGPRVVMVWRQINKIHLTHSLLLRLMETL